MATTMDRPLLPNMEKSQPGKSFKLTYQGFMLIQVYLLEDQRKSKNYFSTTTILLVSLELFDYSKTSQFWI